MDSIRVSIKLNALIGAKRIKDPSGKDGMFIPFEDNGVYVSENTGNAYLKLACWANSTGNLDQYGNSHSVRLDFSKEYRTAHPQVTNTIVGSGKPAGLRNAAANNAPSAFIPAPPPGYTAVSQQYNAYNQPTQAPQTPTTTNGMPF